MKSRKTEKNAWNVLPSRPIDGDVVAESVAGRSPEECLRSKVRVGWCQTPGTAFTILSILNFVCSVFTPSVLQAQYRLLVKAEGRTGLFPEAEERAGYKNGSRQQTQRQGLSLLPRVQTDNHEPHSHQSAGLQSGSAHLQLQAGRVCPREVVSILPGISRLLPTSSWS